MFKRLYNEATIKLSIELEGPILIKASESGADPTRPDMEFVRTIYQDRETIYLPGSSLKGVIRAHCERLARTIQPEKAANELSQQRLSCDPLHDRFSCWHQWEEEKRRKQHNGPSSEEIYRKSCFVCRLFGNTSLSSRLRVTDAYPDDLNKVKTEERNGVAIDRVFGSVAHGPFNYEVAVSGIFNWRLHVRNFTIAQLGLLALAMRDLEMQRAGVGFAKSRGLGRVKARVNKVVFRYPACTLDGTLKLLGGSKPGIPPTRLAGAGMFAPGEGYGLDNADVITLPDGIALAVDDWGEPCVALTDDVKIKALWRECVKAWRQVVEQVVSQR
jgi:CRISPR-associated RAMP protein (TIGR02581 family)